MKGTIFRSAWTSSLYKQQKGFTLVELVTVLVLLGILTAAVAPRFSNRDGFSDYAVRDQIVAAARITQQRAMYHHSANTCYRISVASNQLSVQRGTDDDSDGVFTNYVNIGPTQNWVNGLQFEGNATVTPIDIYFDGLGNNIGSVPNCAGTPSETEILIAGSSNAGVCIRETGHVQSRSC